MRKINFKRFIIYALRWQLSTFILAPIMGWMSWANPWLAATVANFIGSCIFYFVDQFIFTSNFLSPQWEVRENIVCVDCGTESRGYRLVKTENYDKRKEKEPEFRCEECSIRKSLELKASGILH